MLSTQLSRLHPSFVLPQYAYDLILGKSASPHHSSPSDELTYHGIISGEQVTDNPVGAPVPLDHQEVPSGRARVAAPWRYSKDRREVGIGAPRRALPCPIDNAPVLRSLAGHFGTILDVKGQWYVRLEGGERVMNPATTSLGVSLTDDQTYELYGSWEGRRYLIHRADPIDVPPKGS